jgi:NADPH:quinone reductase-like Zn-dependent oxidoreductase
MKAIIQDEYGTHDVLRLEEIDTPDIGDDEVLVRVHAASVAAGDVLLMRGKPFLVRLMGFGVFKPKLRVRGLDVAGQVEAVGKKVNRFRPGDTVFGECEATLAEYVRTTEDHLEPKPKGLTFEQAAALPVSGLAALHAVRDAAKVKPGQKVLINGASGGVGSYAVQIAKAYGAEVTGVCSTRNVEQVRSIGADHVIDYTREDFTQGDERYDLILDNVENHPLSSVRRVLTDHGTLLLNSGTGDDGIGMVVRMIKPLLLSPFVRHRLARFVSSPSSEDLRVLVDLVEAGKITPVIDRSYPLAEAAEAMGRVESGHARGKVVVDVYRGKSTSVDGESSPTVG